MFLEIGPSLLTLIRFSRTFTEVKLRRAELEIDATLANTHNPFVALYLFFCCLVFLDLTLSGI